jgi:1,4-dihydroxy-2-naphthoate octaprenyltransferase
MKNMLLHLRLNMSLVLAPVFMWGFFLAGGTINLKFISAFIAFHIFLYGGSNAYNSYYDKDEGPIGGLKNPPKVTDSLLYFSLACKFFGFGISWFINFPFFITYLAFFILSIIYSHPATRWKANPYLGILTIGIGQGGIAYLAGWFSCTTVINSIPILISGMLTTIFMSMGIYPLTQLYQVEEDKKRNDMTFAVYWGIIGTFKFSVLSVFLSSISILIVLYLRKSYFDLSLISIFYIIFLSQILLWAKKYQAEDILENYSKIMKLNYSNGFGFMIYITLHLLNLL